MKNKTLIFLFLLFLGGILAPLQAMPPKIFKGKSSEEKKEEEADKAYNTQEQGRRLTDVGDLSNTLERAKGLSEREEVVISDHSKDLDLDLDHIDKTVTAILQAIQECEGQIASTSVVALDDAVLREKAEEVEAVMKYWARQKSNISSLLTMRLQRNEASDIGEEQKLSHALTLCRDLWMKWDGFFSEIQDEIEKREFGITSDEDQASEIASVSDLEKPMASMKLSDSSVGGGIAGLMKKPALISFDSSSKSSLESRLNNFLATPHLVFFTSVDSQLSLIQKHQQQVTKGIQKLLKVPTNEVRLTADLLKLLKQEGEKFRKQVQKNWEDTANNYYSQAETQYRGRKAAKAIQNYTHAIVAADQAVQIWSDTEIFYTKLRDIVRGKVRRFGMNIKKRLKKNISEWQLKIDEITLERKRNLDRIFQKLNPLQTERNAILERATVVEKVGKNEVGTTCRAIAGNLAAMIFHLETARDAYNQYNLIQGHESETIADEIQQEVDRLKPHLETRWSLWHEWKERNFEPQCLETGSNNRSIWKMRFMGPLIRKEVIPASGTDPEHELEMAAEHLMVILKEGETKQSFCDALTSLGYPKCKLEAVSKGNALYRLYFQCKENSWLQTMDTLKNSIQENQLALRCYPDYMMELDSITPTAANGVALAAPVQEPWAFYHDKGLHPPAQLFDSQHPLLQTPPTPIKVAIIDSGVFGSIATRAFETHDALVNKIIYEFNTRHKKAAGFGYNAVDGLHPNEPEDFDGHGTHVAGIIAATHGVVPNVAGLAGMPGFIQLIICKWIEPVQGKGLCSNAIKCIEYAQQQEAQIINCSWGRRLYGPKNPTGFTPEEIQDLESVIRDKPFTLVASSGNNLLGGGIGEDLYFINRYPCNFVLPNLISVAGTDKEGNVPNNFSNFGKNSIHLAAPGEDIVSTGIETQTDIKTKTGSSQATPYVTAALVLANIQFPFLGKKLAHYLRYACTVEPSNVMQVKHGPLNLTNVLSTEKLKAFLKTQKMTDEEIQNLLKPQKQKKKK